MSIIGATMYAFGDSILRGHAYPGSACPERTARAIGMNAVNMARNGATICPTPLASADLGGQILCQCDEVPAGVPRPDAIVFDGFTNDIHQGFDRTKLGEVDSQPCSAWSKDGHAESCAGWFEATIARMRELWPGVPIVYVAVGKNGRLPWGSQLAVRDIYRRACAKWDVTIADVFADAPLDTRRDFDRIHYSFDALGSDGLPGRNGTITYDDPATQPSGTHPNLVALDLFYVPVLGRTLLELLD